ncbi:transposase [Anaerostipes sp.]|uniref:transposase n=1 Tax=Anaerostipes sp. TaxID=1872530 RepID=UPI0035280F97
MGKPETYKTIMNLRNCWIFYITDQTVTYLVKDYRNGGRYIPHTIKRIDFLRMFLMHVLPKGFVKIRHYRLQVYDKKIK